MTIEVRIVNAFVYQSQGGNPAGVVLDADELTSDQKLKIAAKVGLSETAFVSRSSVADFKLDFFTPNRQIAHCGHATIATFSYLSQLGRISGAHTSKETIDGRREIALKNDLAFMEQIAPSYFEPITIRSKILRSLGISEHQLLNDMPIVVANTGNSFLIVPLRSKSDLKSLSPDMELIRGISDELGLIGYYPFSTETFDPSGDASARMFAPRYGITEESATGMAGGPLACYLYDFCGLKKQRMIIEQGWLMSEPSPSQIIVDLETDANTVTRLMAGGKGIVSATKTIELDDDI